MTDRKQCDICGRGFDAGEQSDRLCDLCSVCENARVLEGAMATPRYHRDRKIQ